MLRIYQLNERQSRRMRKLGNNHWNWETQKLGIDRIRDLGVGIGDRNKQGERIDRSLNLQEFCPFETRPDKEVRREKSLNSGVTGVRD